MCCKCCSVRQQKIWVFTLGALFLVLGIGFICVWPPMVRKMIYKELPLTPDSLTFTKWEITPVPVYMHMYLWNWTNPDQARNPDVKPNFVPMGPYVFREEKIKEDIKWNENKTVTYFGTRTWFFEPKMTNGTLQDLVTCPHLPTLATTNSVRNESWVTKTFVNKMLNSKGGMLVTTHTVNEWLFEGYFDDYLNFAMSLNRPDVPIETPYFGLFLGRNGSKEYDGTYTVHTGQGDLSQMGYLTHWNGSSHTGYYEGECGKVNGSTGDLWEPNRAEGEPITMFVPDTCRFINMYPGERVKVFGIEGIKYGSNEMTFNSGDLYPEMKCFCPPEAEECAKPGVIDISPCAEGAPMYLSHAHFYLADPSFSENITGMAPDPEKHTFFIIMEPKLGVPLIVNTDVMVSLRVRRDDDFSILKGIRDNFYAPFFTISQRAQIDDALASEIRLALGLPFYGLYTGIALTCLGGLMIIVGIIVTLTKNWKGQKSEKSDF